MADLNLFRRMKGAAARRLASGTWDGVPLTAAVIAAVIAVNVLLYTAVSVFSLVIVPKERDRLKLSGATDAMFAQPLEEKREAMIVFCMPEDELKTHETGQYVYQTAKNFAARYPDFIKLSFVNLYTMRDAEGNRVDLSGYAYTENAAGERVKMPVLSTSVLFLYNKDPNLPDQYAHYLLTDTVSSTGFSDFYTLNASGQAIAYNGEEVIASSILRVLSEEKKTAYFTIHHGETADIAFRNALVGAGYTVGDLDLRNEVPANADLIVISSPRSDFEMAKDNSAVRTEIRRLTEYVENGGHLYISLDPYLKSDLPHLSEFIASYGMRVRRSETAESGSAAQILRETENAITADGFTLIADYADGEASPIRDAASGKGGVLLTQTAVLDCDGGKAVPVLRSSSGARPEAGGVVKGEKGVYTIAAYSKTASGGTVFVIPTIYATASDAMVAAGYSNRDFLFALCERLFGMKNVPYGVNCVDLSDAVLENLTLRTARIYTAILFAVPVAVIPTGVIMLRRRKNR